MENGAAKRSWLPEAPRSLSTDDILGFFAQFRERAGLRRILILVNVAGVAYGFYYYAPQFAITPPALWPFVPDSPLSVGLIALVLLLDEFGVRNRLLEAFAFIDLVKVGAWTGFVLTYYEAAFHIFRDPLSNLNFYLFWLHVAMVVEAFVLAKGLVRVPNGIFVILAAFAVELYMDYGFTGFAFGGCPGTRPITVPCVDNDLLGGVTVGLTALGVAAYLVISKRNAAQSPQDSP
ncbi:MAG: DUF1405 domain-containing protein [Euryarchaeota archaeon]|nr:DUF1405 domain-containing protein [Euryarchaeota archaeon]